MGNPSVPHPTDGEMAILRVLWERGPSTVRDVHTALEASRGVGYTTVLKMLQIMLDKGIVTRDASRRPHIYAPAQAREVVQDGLLSALVRKAFGGSAADLVMRALAARKPSADELRDIRSLLDEIEAGEEE